MRKRKKKSKKGGEGGGEIGWVGRFRFDLIWVVKGEGGGERAKGKRK